MKHINDSLPLPSNLFGPTQNDLILVEKLNALKSITQRRSIVGQIMAFKQRGNTLLFVPPTKTRMSHCLRFLQLDYEEVVEKMGIWKSTPMYPRILGVIRGIRNSIASRLVNSMKMLGYKELLGKINGTSKGVILPEAEILAVYPYGSRVYGTSRPASDYDFIIISKSTTMDTLGIANDIHATIYSLEDYQRRLEEHEISILECMSLPREMMVKSLVHPQLAAINVNQLRISISAKSSNSLVKAKKKLTVYSDRQSHYIGLKSLFHSLRMIRFAIQVAEHGRIIDYGECNELYHEMMNETTLDWEYLKEKYKHLHNKWMTEFRELAPKPSN